MTRTTLMMTLLVAMAAVIGSGCDKQATTPRPPAVVTPAEVKPMTHKLLVTSDKLGQVPAGWAAASGTWKVAADATSPSKGPVLAQTAANPSTDFNVVLAPAPAMKDVDISVKVRAVAGIGDQGGGPVWRAVDGKNYYVARWNPLEANYRLYKMVDGKRTQLATVDLKGIATGWHTLRVTMKGDAIECYLDGKSVVTAKDSTFAAAGKVGVWTKGDAATNFDELTVMGK
jgi:hypothetical protein